MDIEGSSIGMSSSSGSSYSWKDRARRGGSGSRGSVLGIRISFFGFGFGCFWSQFEGFLWIVTIGMNYFVDFLLLGLLFQICSKLIGCSSSSSSCKSSNSYLTQLPYCPPSSASSPSQPLSSSPSKFEFEFPQTFFFGLLLFSGMANVCLFSSFRLPLRSEWLCSRSQFFYLRYSYLNCQTRVMIRVMRSRRDSSIFLSMFCFTGLKLENLKISSGSYFKESIRFLLSFSLISCPQIWLMMNVSTDGLISRIWLVEFFQPIYLFNLRRLLRNVEQKWFLISLSVRPGRQRVSYFHLLPCTLCIQKRQFSSSGCH